MTLALPAPRGSPPSLPPQFRRGSAGKGEPVGVQTRLGALLFWSGTGAPPAGSRPSAGALTPLGFQASDLSGQVPSLPHPPSWLGEGASVPARPAAWEQAFEKSSLCWVIHRTCSTKGAGAEFSLKRTIHPRVLLGKLSCRARKSMQRPGFRPPPPLV